MLKRPLYVFYLNDGVLGGLNLGPAVCVWRTQRERSILLVPVSPEDTNSAVEPLPSVVLGPSIDEDVYPMDRRSRWGTS